MRPCLPSTLLLVLALPTGALAEDVPLGHELQVNTCTAGTPIFASVAADTNSRF